MCVIKFIDGCTKRASSAILDVVMTRLFGPVDFDIEEYISTTSPATPPPDHA